MPLDCEHDAPVFVIIAIVVAEEITLEISIKSASISYILKE